MSFRRLMFASVLVFASVASAQTTTTTAAAPVFDPATAPHVTAATGYGPKNTAGLGDRLQVTVRNFPTLLAKVPSCHAIILFIDGLPLRDMPPESCNPYDGTVRYFLDRVPGSNDTEWHRLLGSPNGF